MKSLASGGGYLAGVVVWFFNLTKNLTKLTPAVKIFNTTC